MGTLEINSSQKKHQKMTTKKNRNLFTFKEQFQNLANFFSDEN